MAVAPDIHYFLQSSCECVHMTSDTYYYFMYLHPDTNGFIDNYPTEARRNRTFRYRKHMDTLRDMGAYCEEEYLRFRAEHREVAFAASHYNTETIADQLETFVNEFSVQMVNRGHQRATERAIEQADREYGFHENLAVLKRACMRSYHDSDGYDPERITQALALSNLQWEIHRSDSIEQLNDLRRSLGRTSDGSRERNRRRAEANLRKKITQDRKVAKRSVRLAERFLGTEKTRMFVGGDEIRIQGKLATYVIKKTGQILSSHSGARLSVWNHEGDRFLCNLCIYTAKVPMLDHVISLLLHIRSGCEEEILAGGNPFDVKPSAYDEPWLVPHLPKRVVGTPGRVRGGREIPRLRGALYECYREPDRQDRIDVLRRELAVILFDHLGAYCPAIPHTRAMLLAGLDQRRYLLANEAREALGVAELPTNTAMAEFYNEYLNDLDGEPEPDWLDLAPPELERDAVLVAAEV